MIDTAELTEQTFEVPGDCLLSDWMENQPLSRFAPNEMRNAEGQMCGLGMSADFYGINWNLRERGDNGYVQGFLTTIWGRYSDDNGKRIWPISATKFDLVYESKGPQAAKDYVVDSLREKGM